MKLSGSIPTPIAPTLPAAWTGSIATMTLPDLDERYHLELRGGSDFGEPILQSGAPSLTQAISAAKRLSSDNPVGGAFAVLQGKDGAFTVAELAFREFTDGAPMNAQVEEADWGSIEFSKLHEDVRAIVDTDATFTAPARA